MRIPEETINDIRESANIVNVISHYIPISKKGKNYVAICPFHDDHDPSMSISEERNMFKCFVCGVGGNSFTFVQKFKNCRYLEAVGEVAKIIGKPIDIDLSQPKKVNKNQGYYDLLNDYIEYTNYILTSTKLGLDAKAYLENRGIDLETINKFSIGYCPEKNEAYKSLKAKSYSDEAIINLNIARLGNNGINDVFYKRIVFPIHDKYGNPVAFTARDFTGFSDSKYINSSETVIYTKGNILFNLNRAKDYISRNDSVIVCEGVMDVIAYSRAGIENVVATLGTACTKQQLNLFKELGKTVILSYDGDEAGQAANIKVGEFLLKNGLKVEVIDNNTELDPDEIISKYGKNALRDLSNKKLSFIEYSLKYYKNKYNLNNFEDRKKMSQKVIELISYLSDIDEKENYLNELYDITKIRSRIVEKKDKKVYDNADKIKVFFSLNGLTMAEYTILSMMALNENAKNIYQKELGYLLDENNMNLANLIIDEYRKNGVCQLAKLYDECNDAGVQNVIASLGTIETLPEDYNEEVLLGAIERIKREIKKRKLDDLKKAITKYKDIDQEKTSEYLKEYTKLLQELGGN